MSEPVNTPTPIEPGADPTPTPAQDPTPTFDMGELEERISKGVEIKIGGILKDFAEKNSLNLDELKAEFQKSQNNKKLEDVKDTEAYKTLQEQYNQLKTTVKTNRINDEIKRIAVENGLTQEQLPYIHNLFKTEEIYNDNDETVDIEKITEGITGFVNAFKPAGSKSLGYPGGSDDKNQGDKKQIKTDSEKELDRIFGLL